MMEVFINNIPCPKNPSKSGLGVYIADTDGSEDAKKYPPQDGYKVLQNAKLPLPTVIVKTRNNNNKEGNEML